MTEYPSDKSRNALMEQTSFLSGTNSHFIEHLHALYLKNPASVDSSWQTFFESLGEDPSLVEAEATGAPWKRADWPKQPTHDWVAALDSNWSAAEDAMASKQKARKPEASSEDIRSATLDSIRAIMMIRAYRIRGHLAANLDPLGLEKPVPHPELDPASYGFTPADYDRKIFIDYVLGLEEATIPQILDILKRTYCSTIGVEFMHISDPAEKGWIQERIEGVGKEVQFTPEGKHAIMDRMIEAEEFEKFLARKYTGTKRFGLDGGESLIPAMEGIIKRGGQLGVDEIILGMPHRGRLNVLANVFGKPHRAILHEFHGGSANPDDIEGSGDVKYHLGTSSDREFDGHKVHLSLTANPSHLEIVNPVVLGKVRAKQWQKGDMEHKQVLPILLHGDAAFSGQGVVAECFALSGLKGYKCGGTIHIIVNNQIGFTTAPQYSRSSPYPSDMAKMVAAPIFHVNGDDPEAVCYVAKVATEYRQQFGKDVVIDMFCYRRFGHNEGDEPSFTNPLMYKEIRQHRFASEIYGERLIKEGEIAADYIEKKRNEVVSFLENELEAAKSYRPNRADWLEGKWAGLGTAPHLEARRGSTGVSMDVLKEVGAALTTIPETHKVHRTINRFMKARKEAIDSGQGIDWATAEALAFGTLQVEGHKIRLSGQDCGRGTFSQRHSVLVDQETEERYLPLNNIREDAAEYEVIDSLLSEAAVLGYEYGYTMAEPNALVMWEAQFGDFANGAQVVVDQFISSGETKWLRMSGLVMLLPHGFEGQGPEHSSARLERYLQLCGWDNMQVANCTTPANYYHILRRQLHRKFRKPLILMTPKSLLRHKRCVSTLEDMGPDSSFHRVLWDDSETSPGTTIKLKKDKDIKRVVLCSGKVYFDLLEERENRELDDVYLMRVEQLYPFPDKALTKELTRFKHCEIVWCQEEPKNMGAWSFIEPYLEEVLVEIGAKQTRARYAGRESAASPATGLMSKHLAQLAKFLEEALVG